jgi:hypothetical protein
LTGALDAHDDLESLLPSLEEDRYQVGRVLQIRRESDHGIAVRLEHPVVRRPDVAEVAAVYDDLHVLVGAGELPQDGEGSVR